jgi:hypothetical protein
LWPHSPLSASIRVDGVCDHSVIANTIWSRLLCQSKLGRKADVEIVMHRCCLEAVIDADHLLLMEGIHFFLPSASSATYFVPRQQLCGSRVLNSLQLATPMQG